MKLDRELTKAEKLLPGFICLAVGLLILYFAFWIAKSIYVKSYLNEESISFIAVSIAIGIFIFSCTFLGTAVSLLFDRKQKRKESVRPSLKLFMASLLFIGVVTFDIFLLINLDMLKDYLSQNNGRFALLGAMLGPFVLGHYLFNNIKLLIKRKDF